MRSGVCVNARTHSWRQVAEGKESSLRGRAKSAVVHDGDDRTVGGLSPLCIWRARFWWFRRSHATNLSQSRQIRQKLLPNTVVFLQQI